MTEQSDEERITAIEARASAATDGPWWPVGSDSRFAPVNCDPVNVVPPVRRRDAEFIAHSREDVPWLIERLRATEADVESGREHRRWLMGQLRGERHRAENYKARVTELEADVAARDTVISAAPHAGDCGLNETGLDNLPIGIPCTCWKSAAPVSVLREHAAAVWDEGFDAGTKFGAAQWPDHPRRENPYRAGSDQ